MRWVTYDAGNGIRTGILDVDDTVRGLAPGNSLLGLVRAGEQGQRDNAGGWLRPGDIVTLRGAGLGETRQRIVPGIDVIPLRSGC
ncbi:MAG: hypothetical protein IPH03_01740 [Tetrasphaera sp.]|jgi:hypothetical protein|nr:hypothetical protein [Tetrasphaera sp.]